MFITFLELDKYTKMSTKSANMQNAHSTQTNVPSTKMHLPDCNKSAVKSEHTKHEQNESCLKILEEVYVYISIVFKSQKYQIKNTINYYSKYVSKRNRLKTK